MISSLFQEWLKRQQPFRDGGPFSTSSAESKSRKEVMNLIKEEFESLVAENDLKIGSNPIEIDSSRGITNDTNVPWIRFFDDRTPRPTEGWSLVTFASEDAESIVLVIGLGVYKGASKKGALTFTNRLLEDEKIPRHYRVRPEIGGPGIASAYESSSPVSFTWSKEKLAQLTDDDFLATLKEFLELFNYVLDSYPAPKPEGRLGTLSGKWLVQFNPSYWDFDSFIAAGHKDFSFKIGNFKEAIQEGDPVVIWRSGSRAGIVGIGRVKLGPEDRVPDDLTLNFYKVPTDAEEVTTRIQVSIDTIFENYIPKSAVLSALAKNTILTAPPSTSPFPLTDIEYQEILRLSGLNAKEKAEQTLGELAQDLLVSEDWLKLVVDEITNKKQVVFQGPPGTGKTFLAKAIANYLADGQAVVQFHPSYSYEDFVEGYRPVRHGDLITFEIKPGPLVAIANEARTKPDKKFVLIIDELNRGNLAKVFGELYFLLEYRNDEVTMQYRSYGESFTLPENLIIIGTMNTADRSISSLDLAIRRRFSFIELNPDSEPISGLLERWLTKNDKPLYPSRILEFVNSLIMDSRVKLGPSYFMNKQVETEFEKIWQFQVFPQLREIFFDKQEVLDSVTYTAVSKFIQK